MCTRDVLTTVNNKEMKGDGTKTLYMESGRNEPSVSSIPRHNESTSGCNEGYSDTETNR